VSGQRAAFIDRDGVLNEDRGYVSRAEDFHWLPGAVPALARLQGAGYALVIVTNQSGIARGFYTQADFEALTAHMREQLRAAGVTLDAVESCPHLPTATVPEYRLDCDCRKPRPGMILRAAQALDLDLAASCLFGDKARDIAAGRAAGVGRCWLIGDASSLSSCDADGVSASLSLAVDTLLSGCHAH
jgi:D-glycero-D-manno-heptose 1,7-bisphosphate phosphatase